MHPTPPTRIATTELPSLLEEGRWFSAIPAELQQWLLQHGERKPLHKGQALFLRGDAPDGLYCVLTGALRIGYCNAEGKEAVLTYIDPPNWFGEISLLDQQARTHDAIAETNSEVLHIPHRALLRLFEAKPAWWRYIGLLVTQKLRLAFTAIEDLSLRPAPQRLAHRLLLIGEGYGETLSSRVTIRLHQEQLGNLLSISRQTTNQILKDLEARELIRLSYKGIEIIDKAGLRRFAGAETVSSA